MSTPLSFNRLFAATRGLAVRLDQLRFRDARSDYYEFLAAVIAGTKGRQSLRDIFDLDARRYTSSVRGRLAAHWSKTYSTAGGDLYATWAGCFPASELAVLRLAQMAGNDALVKTLHEMAHAVELARRSRHLLWTTVWSGLVAMVVLFVTLLALPTFTVPRLKQVFSGLPAEYLGALTQALFNFSDWVGSAWLVGLASALGAMVFVVWSIPNLTGGVRSRLDQISIWRIYRFMQALRFMSVLMVVLQRHSAAPTQLRTALTLLCAGASPWLRQHLDDMLVHIDHGVVGAETFDTGLLDRELYWYLQDMTHARGLVVALSLTRDRLINKVLPQVARYALALRWALLGICVSAMLALGLWHYVAIDELRRALMIFHASQ